MKKSTKHVRKTTPGRIVKRLERDPAALRLVVLLVEKLRLPPSRSP